MAGEYVLKRWQISAEPKPKAPTLVSIQGRAPGLMGFLLNLVGLDPTITFDVTERSIEYTSSHVRGQSTRVIPLCGVSSTYYGYEKPIEILVPAVLFLMMGFPTALTGLVGKGGTGPVMIGALFTFVGVALVVKYLLSKALTLGVVENSGVISAIRFKASVIEGVQVNEQECQKVNMLIKELVEAAS